MLLLRWIAYCTAYWFRFLAKDYLKIFNYEITIQLHQSPNYIVDVFYLLIASITGRFQLPHN